ncbi:histidine phosphatase family containing protein [Ceratobasidium sp. AG-Ba]|nr:histidine phosphatase family containing protein [Ceratobasidium sp. AG-Ba]
MVETIYIARHGFRLSWITRQWESPTGLPKDPPLAAYGIEQAEHLAKHINGLPEDKRPTLLFSSPYYRCLQTANPTSEILSLPILVEHGLSEWYSLAEPGTGLHPRPYTAQALQQYFPSIDASWESICFPDQRGETVEGVHKRCSDYLRALVSRIEQHPTLKMHKNIMFVSHAATAIALVRSLVGDKQLPLRVGTCTLSTLNRVGKGGFQWEAEGVLAGGEFLPNGVERDWGFEDVQLDESGSVINDIGIRGTENEDPGFSGIVPEKSL